MRETSGEGWRDSGTCWTMCPNSLATLVSCSQVGQTEEQTGNLAAIVRRVRHCFVARNAG